MTLGKRINQARKARGLSLEKLGKKMSVSKQLVWQWEKDESDPRKHIERLCAVLEVPYDYFYGKPPHADTLEAKIQRLAPQQRPIAEATIDALLAQQAPLPKARSVK